MKNLLTIILLLSLVVLTGCVTTNVYPGQKEGRVYESQNTRVCESIEIVCDENQTPFNDYTGCGCELAEEPAEEPSEEPVEEPAVEPFDEPVTEPVNENGECIITLENPEEGTLQYDNCPDGTMCGMVEWISSEPFLRCIPNNICESSMCGEGSECVILESYPVQIKCQPIVDETTGEEPAPADEPETVTTENAE